MNSDRFSHQDKSNMDEIVEHIFLGITGPIYDAFMSLGIVFALNDVDPDEIPIRCISSGSLLFV